MLTVPEEKGLGVKARHRGEMRPSWTGAVARCTKSALAQTAASAAPSTDPPAPSMAPALPAALPPVPFSATQPEGGFLHLPLPDKSPGQQLPERNAERSVFPICWFLVHSAAELLQGGSAAQ